MTDNHKIVKTPEVAIQQEQRELHPLILALADGRISIEQMEKVQDFQIRYEQREAKKAYDAAMIRLRRDLPTFITQDKEVLFKDREGKTVNYTHATLANATDMIVPYLAQYGFSHCWIPTNDDKLVRVTTKLTHEYGHSEECTLCSAPDLSGKKSPSQGIASTITRLERYGFLALLGIATKDMREIDPRKNAESHQDAVDSEKNLQAVAYMQSIGITVHEAEKQVQRDVKSWTAGDLEKLRTWITKKQASKKQVKKVEKDRAVTVENPETTKAKQELGDLQRQAIDLAKKLYGEEDYMRRLSGLCRNAPEKFSITNATKEQSQWTITELKDMIAAKEEENNE